MASTKWAGASRRVWASISGAVFTVLTALSLIDASLADAIVTPAVELVRLCGGDLDAAKLRGALLAISALAAVLLGRARVVNPDPRPLRLLPVLALLMLTAGGCAGTLQGSLDATEDAITTACEEAMAPRVITQLDAAQRVRVGELCAAGGESLLAAQAAHDAAGDAPAARSGLAAARRAIAELRVILASADQ